MLLEVRSIAYVTTVNLFIFALAFFVQWLRERDRSLLDWTIAFALGVIGAGLTGLRGMVADIVSVGLGITALQLVYAYVLLGLYQHFGERPSWVAWLNPAVTFALCYYFVVVDHYPPAWPTIIGFMRFLSCAQICAMLWKRRARMSLPVASLLQISSAIMGLYMLGRAVAAPWMPHSEDFTVSSAPAITYLITAACTFMMTMGLLSVHVDRLLTRLEDAANTDVLTGLRNRRFFNEMGRTELDRSIRDGHSLWVLMIDIDHFKDINDTLGHAEGDRVLYQLGQVFRESLRSYDMVARYGGEEFCALLSNTEAEAAQVVAERLLQRVRELRIGPKHNHVVTISIGATQRGDGDRMLEDILKRADQALYEAKAAGRNCIVGFDEMRASSGMSAAGRA